MINSRLKHLHNRHFGERADLIANGPSLNKIKLGFLWREIVIDMDYRYEFNGESNEEHRLDGPDQNHFTSGYFDGRLNWDTPVLPHSEESYRITRTEYEKNGRRIIDATLKWACTIFGKADYRQVFGFNV